MVESVILKEKERFEALFQYASLGILVANDKGVIQMANNCLLKQFGYENTDELISKAIEVLIPGRYHTNHAKYRTRYSQHPEPREMGMGRDLFAMRKDGTEFPVEISLSNYSTSEGNFAIAFISDITRRKEIDRDVQLQKERLAEVNLQIEQMNNELERKVEDRTLRLQEAMELLRTSRDELTLSLSKEKELSDLKSRFVSMASHEFRTPLSTILSSASLLAKYTDTEEQEKRDKHIQRIKASVNNLTGILNEFLSIGKIEDGKIVANYCEFNVKEEVDSICSEMRSVTTAGQSISCLHKGKELIVSDPSMIRNIILNLLSNALKFTHEGGSISVATENTKGALNISISDDGIGISEEDQHHLFERFFRAKNATNIQGTGLGLHIVGKYVELLNGRIDWESQLEKGTRFSIDLPKQNEID